MPNLCDNRLTIWCDDSTTLAKICDAAAPPSISLFDKLASKFRFRSLPRSETGFLHFLHPMPANVEELDIEVLPQLPNKPKSYFWRVENWGCQHDFAYEFQRTSETELRSDFTTPYSPPVGALQHGAAQYGFRFRLLYCETGAGFCGIATEAGNNEFEITFDRSPAEEGVPQELIETFALHEAYLEVAAEQA